MLNPSYDIPSLPLGADLETRPVLKKLVEAKSALLHLKGIAQTIPNQGILINTLAIQEAQASSEIENIVTTQDDLFNGILFPDATSGPAKEVARYPDVLRQGFARMQAQQGMITNAMLIEMFRSLKAREDGFRTMPGTVLANSSGAHVYIPPQSSDEIQAHMAALERYVNDNAIDGLDPLIKMAIIHHQFESIHPFPDGNGRVGRMLNVLYLVQQGLLDIPILYLSRHINRTKADYYRLLQAVRDEGVWEDWVVYILTAVAETATVTVQMIGAMRDQMANYKARLRAEFPKIYSHDLLNNLFRHPYTRIEFVMNDLGVSRPTATKYLDLLAGSGLIRKHSRGRDNYYVNTPLIEIFRRFGAP